jgi:hypothetical protein
MITGMSQPLAIQGNVVEPSHISQPHSFAAHDFFNTVRDLVHRTPYHNESERDAALNSIGSYEKHVTGSDAAYVLDEGDRAPVEDVSQRRPPSGLPSTVAPGATIDYAKLAAAIVAAQQAQAQAQQQAAVTPPVTDVTSGMRPAGT